MNERIQGEVKMQSQNATSQPPGRFLNTQGLFSTSSLLPFLFPLFSFFSIHFSVALSHLLPQSLLSQGIETTPWEETAQAAGRRPWAGSAARGGSAAGGSGGGRGQRWVMAPALPGALRRPGVSARPQEVAAIPSRRGAPQTSVAVRGDLIKPRAINPRAAWGRLWARACGGALGTE